MDRAVISLLVRRMSRSSIIIREMQMATMAIHPGEHIAEELEVLDMSAAELARRLSVPTNRITAIINGQRAITGDTALRLAHFFGTTPEFWLNRVCTTFASLNEKLVSRLRTCRSSNDEPQYPFKSIRRSGTSTRDHPKYFGGWR